MAIDPYAKGWILGTHKEKKDGVEWCFKKVVPYDRKAFDEAVKYSFQNLKKSFPDLDIVVKKGKFLLRSVEITGKPLELYHKSMFWIKYTPKKIYVKVYGLDSESVINCLM